MGGNRAQDSTRTFGVMRAQRWGPERYVTAPLKFMFVCNIAGGLLHEALACTSAQQPTPVGNPSK